MKDTTVVQMEAGTPVEAPRSLFRPLDWVAFWTASVISFAVYFISLAPTVTLEDSGELATASAFLGVPHPPGYPIWSILTWVFSKLFAFVTFRGQPNPAFGVGMLSAVFGALASGLTAILICRSGRDMLRGMKRTTELIGTRAEDAICWAGGVSGSLIFAFSSVNWSQAVIAEVYSLNAFFLVLVLFLTYVWMRNPGEKLYWLSGLIGGIGLICFLTMAGLTVLHVRVYEDFRDVGMHYVLSILLLALLSAAAVYAWKAHPRDRVLYLIALSFGMGLTNYQVLLLLIASLAIVVLLKDLRLFRDFLIAGLPFLVVYVLSEKGFVNQANVMNLPADIPKTYATGYAAALLYAIGSGATVGLLAMFGEKGRFRLLKQYLLLSIPLVCLGLLLWRHALVPGTIKGVSPLFPSVPHPTDPVCFAYIALNVVALVCAYFFLPYGKTVAPTILCLELGLAIYAFMPLASEMNPPMNWAFPRTWEGFKHAISRGQYERIVATPIFSREFLNQIGTYFQDLRITFTLPIAILGFLPFTAWRIKLGEARFRAVYVSTLMAATAVLLIALEEFLAPATGEILALTMVYRGVIASILVLLCIGGGVMIVAEVWDFFARLFTDRPDSPLELHEDDTVSTDMDGISRKWIVVTLSGFLVMSLILIMLASPKGDIQDAFIQRVKFISSHALFALWIGYGLIVALGALGAMLGGNRVLIYAATAVAALLWIEPIRQNAFNRELVRVYGGAEQGANNDFGWQFGNYQLRGADAFHEELSPDEEPLPNPCFPPEMGTNAIFFGGTDPGRFVPTYMIYGARVREDVYLITQNALADNTYMNVMRDLYGDQIWIPAQKDSARAFQRYVEEVNSGKRPRNAQLTIENGRVQVSGALGVMEINGILAEMIFEHNSFRHDFYVEESYVIPWMYPYLTPHGLIMKINARHTPLTPQMNRDDTDLWDWYCRRFSDNPLFRRDVVARKSFSKLRSAIAGLYRSRGDFERAEAAFQQARILYPLSPEANFRLVQEVLMAFRRFGESREIMGDFAAQDPGNTKVFEFLDQLDQLDQLHKRVEEIEKEMSKGMQLDANKAVELATLYLQVGQIPKFNAMAASILNNKDLPSMYHYQVAQLYSRNKDMANMVKALDLCLPHIPTNAPSNLLLDIAQLYAKARRLDRMLESMLVYVKRKPDDWRAWLDVAAMQVGMKRNDEANKALDQAVRYGGSEALDMIMEDSRFESFRKKLAPPNPAVFGLDGRSGLRAPFGTP